MLDQAVKMQALLATKLRLATMSRIGPRTAGRAHNEHKPSAYETVPGSGTLSKCLTTLIVMRWNAA